jgi:hypothetical protein
VTVTTRWRVVERSDFEEVRGGPDGEVTGYDVIDGDWPDARWISEARRVVQTVDEESCALTYITDDATGQMCSNPIGWVLNDDDDDPSRGVFFRDFVLVEVGMPGRGTGVGEHGKIVAVCLECGPEDLYGAAALGRQAFHDAVEKRRREVAEERAHRTAIGKSYADELRDKGVE